MEIAIRGEGELVIRFIDKPGQTMQERLTVSGSPKTEALRVIELSLRTAAGDAAVAPVLVSQSNTAQRVRFDRKPRRRCPEESRCSPGSSIRCRDRQPPVPWSDPCHR